VEDRIWSAAELEKLSPAERHEIFLSSIEWTLDDVPEEFLDRVRRMAATRTGESDSA
jgi:hypothetical protein